MCACAGHGQQDLALTRQYRQFSDSVFFKGKNVRFGCFFEGNKVTKGSAMLISWQHRSSPFLQLWVGPWVRQ